MVPPVQASLRFARAVDRLNRAFGRLVALLTGLMVLLGAFNAIARYFERDAGIRLSSNAFLEAQWYLFSLVFLLGAAHTLARNGHVRVDVVYGRLSPRVRAWIDLVGTLVFLLPFCVFALIASWPSIAHSWQVLEVSPDPGGLPRYPIKSAILVCFALLVLQGLSEVVKRIAWLRGDELWEGAVPNLEEPAE